MTAEGESDFLRPHLFSIQYSVFSIQWARREVPPSVKFESLGRLKAELRADLSTFKQPTEYLILNRFERKK
jgi:hypothetical protein